MCDERCAEGWQLQATINDEVGAYLKWLVATVKAQGNLIRAIQRDLRDDDDDIVRMDTELERVMNVLRDGTQSERASLYADPDVPPVWESGAWNTRP